MNLNIYLFYLFSMLALISSLMVISLSNAVHSVLFLILVFCNISALLLLMGAEFLALMLIIVYVGAIAVLFLFVVMMLNINNSSALTVSKFSVLPIGLLVSFILINQFLTATENFDLMKFQKNEVELINWSSKIDIISTAEAIGNVLYTRYSLVFILCGFLLLIAMIGAIVLTMHQRIDVKKQLIQIQLSRNPSNVIKFLRLRK
uniref:NADH-ubiquinone oxidoreductase chain 6 n=1 Tax=Caulacanthus okamurae TaxID=152008 RepID=A0A6H1U8K5_9FLOR|nr:NADH dehydrogenase subunit 6 [Caulacanthus okamurae]QIZ74776.1 NADH dehydrogenase subunit 6 [Caulacanthus okamurae]